MPLAARGGGLEVVVDVRAFEARRNARLGREAGGKVDGFVGDVDAGHAGAAARDAQAVLARVALQVQHREAVHVAEQGAFLGEQRGAARAEEGGLVALVAVVRDRGGVPRLAVGFVQVFLHGVVASGRVGQPARWRSAMPVSAVIHAGLSLRQGM
ncbi:hypothetical protein D9M68_425840 [compost metagenome]